MLLLLSSIHLLVDFKSSMYKDPQYSLIILLFHNNNNFFSLSKEWKLKKHLLDD